MLVSHWAEEEFIPLVIQNIGICSTLDHRHQNNWRFTMTWEAGWCYGTIATVFYEQQKLYRQIILFQRIYYLSISLTGLPCHREPSIVVMSMPWYLSRKSLAVVFFDAITSMLNYCKETVFICPIWQSVVAIRGVSELRIRGYPHEFWHPHTNPQYFMRMSCGYCK